MSFIQQHSANWTSAYENWHARAQPFPSPSKFTPIRAELVLAVLRNSQVEPEGFTAALFKSAVNGNIAIDAMGRVLILSDRDFDGFASLTKQTLELPKTGSFRNTWVLAHTRTGQFIDRLFVPDSAEGGILLQTSVQGFGKGLKELKRPVGDTTELPDILEELTGLISEARNGYVRGTEDPEVIGRVKAILEDVW